MRKITNEAVSAFMQGRSFKKGNMQVYKLLNVTVMALHGNEIAYRYNDPDSTLSICARGWLTNTTKERLNALPGVNIYQRNFQWYLNDKEWNGELIDIK